MVEGRGQVQITVSTGLGKKRREMCEKGWLKDKGVGEERREGERQGWWNAKVLP